MTNKMKTDDSYTMHAVPTGLLTKSAGISEIQKSCLNTEFNFRDFFIYRAAIYLQSKKLKPFL